MTDTNPPPSASTEGEGCHKSTPSLPPLLRKQSQHSDIAKVAIINTRSAMGPPPNPHPVQAPIATSTPLANITNIDSQEFEIPKPAYKTFLAPPQPSALGRALQAANMGGGHAFQDGVGHPPSDTPRSIGSTPLGSAPSTAPSSPRMKDSGNSTPRIRPPATTLNIPGMTRSRVSPDGKIAQRDVGAKLVVVMVGLPARGKSYITKKIQRYLSWQQHETRIFNVGNRRRVVAGASGSTGLPSAPTSPQSSLPRVSVIRTSSIQGVLDQPTVAAHMILNGFDPSKYEEDEQDPIGMPNAEHMEQSADFFDPKNEKASAIREQVALSTLDELLDFLLEQGGSVGILDATNSTIARRQIIFNHIKEREPKLGILFIESVCEDEKLLETNMRLKLRGPDYKDKDPESSYEDFKKRVAAYESAYVPIGKYEEDNKMQYIKMIDVGRKMINFQLSGFLTGGIASYLSTFNLSPRRIWITRHGQSTDNCLGKIGGDSPLTEGGRHYGTALYNFVTSKRREWEVDQKRRALESTALPPKAGDATPPYPELLGDLEEKNFCVWTSMLKRSIETAHEFDKDDDYDVKNWEMLNELHAGDFEGKTYQEIAAQFPDDYAKRGRDKLHYVYPGVGGEGYLQVISRLRDMVREIERIKDHVLIIGHRSVCRVLMAYFMDLTRHDIADLDVPLGMLYSIEPKPYGIDFHAYKYDEANYEFNELVGYKPQRETEQSA